VKGNLSRARGDGQQDRTGFGGVRRVAHGVHPWCTAWATACLVLFASVATAWVQGGTAYDILSLDDLGGGFARARAVSDLGVIVGESLLPGDEPPFVQRAVLWQMGLASDLGTLGGANSSGTSVNSTGTLGGWAQNSDGEVRPVVWAGQERQELPTLGGGNGAVWGLNDAGFAVGGAARQDGSYRGALWNGVGDVNELGTLGGDYSVAYDISNSGLIAGTATNRDGRERAVAWGDGGARDLGGLSGGQWTAARAVNDAGEVILWGRPEGGTANQAAFWTGEAGAEVMTLGTFGGEESWAYGLNNSGAVVGWAGTADGAYHAYVWDGTAMTDLGTLGGLYSAAYGINDQGVIAGFAHDAAGTTHAVIWVPVPEPSGGSLLAVGILWLLTRRARSGGPSGI